MPLSLKAFQLLGFLLDSAARGRLKTDLLERLWPETFVSYASLHNLVTEVRAALRDDPRTPRYIRTVPRYGYAFHGEARPAPAAAGTSLCRRRQVPGSYHASASGSCLMERTSLAAVPSARSASTTAASRADTRASSSQG